jgi:hypothetical protein
MKFVKFSIITLLLSAAVFSSCKKSSDDISSTGQANQSFAGNWVGAYGFGNEVPAIYYRFNIKSNGTIEELNSSGASKGTGTWNLNGNSFTAKYQWKAPMNTVFSVAATYNSATGKLSGTWGYNNNAADGGLWEQAKQ